MRTQILSLREFSSGIFMSPFPLTCVKINFLCQRQDQSPIRNEILESSLLWASAGADVEGPRPGCGGTGPEVRRGAASSLMQSSAGHLCLKFSVGPWSEKGPTSCQIPQRLLELHGRFTVCPGLSPGGICIRVILAKVFRVSQVPSSSVKWCPQ